MAETIFELAETIFESAETIFESAKTIFELAETRASWYSRYRYRTLGTLLSTESSVLMSVPRYYHDDEDGDDDGDKTAC